LAEIDEEDDQEVHVVTDVQVEVRKKGPPVYLCRCCGRTSMGEAAHEKHLEVK